MTTAVLITLALLPLYLLIREPFRRLPLHIDTGFYVSNHTIATGRFDFSKGWNAHFAGCSKVVPELFYSLVYLAHGRSGGTDGVAGLTRFKRMSRLYASLFNYLTAIAVGFLAYVLSGGNELFYCAGLATFALLSSEPHWGVYFECGELFEMLADVAAVVLVLVGFEVGQPWLVGLGAFVWDAGSIFIKLSSGVAFVILFGGLALVVPWTLVPIVCGGAAAGAMYVGWLAWNRRNPVKLLAAIRGHERSFDQWANWRGVLHRYSEKARGLAIAVRRQPLLPALVVVGLFLSPPGDPVFWLYTAGVVVTYFAQATDCRYYLIPVLPPIALLAASGVIGLVSLGLAGVVILSIVIMIWFIRNPLRAARLSTNRLNLWCWEGTLARREVERNLAVEGAVETIQPLVATDKTLVYGPLTQAYALMDSGYPTPIVTPEHYLDHVCPGWQRPHNARLVDLPPDWIVDTSKSFDAAEARERLGLGYCLRHVFDDEILLYKHVYTSPPSPDYEDARTFQPQSSERLAAERALAGDDVVVHRGDSSDAHTDYDRTVDPASKALAALLTELAGRGYRRLAIYGAGRFTIRHGELYRNSPAEVTVVVDDNAALHGERCLDWPIRSLDDVDETAIDAIVVSTDRFASSMLARVRRRWGDRVRAFAIPT